MLFPEPSRFSSPDATNFLSEPSIELTLSEGQSSRISCLLKRPILFSLALRTISSAESLGYANANNRGTFKRDFVKNYNDIIENDYQEMNANAITRLEFCERNAIPGETIKALTGVTDLKQIESK